MRFLKERERHELPHLLECQFTDNHGSNVVNIPCILTGRPSAVISCQNAAIRQTSSLTSFSATSGERVRRGGYPVFRRLEQHQLYEPERLFVAVEKRRELRCRVERVVVGVNFGAVPRMNAAAILVGAHSGRNHLTLRAHTS